MSSALTCITCKILCEGDSAKNIARMCPTVMLSFVCRKHCVWIWKKKRRAKELCNFSRLLTSYHNTHGVWCSGWRKIWHTGLIHLRKEWMPLITKLMLCWCLDDSPIGTLVEIRYARMCARRKCCELPAFLGAPPPGSARRMLRVARLKLTFYSGLAV